LISHAGSEKVLEQIIRLFPDADLFSILDFVPQGRRGFILDKPVHTSFIQRLPFAKHRYRGYLALMPIAVRHLDLSGYDLIISSSHTVAKGIRKKPTQLHISYCHTPMRYIWDLESQYLKEAGLDRGMKSTALKVFFNRLRKWDVSTSKEVDSFIANSCYIKDRIRRVYERDASVIYPPVEIDGFSMNDKKEDFYLTVSRMVPYKRVDLIVDAFSRLGLPLVVIGDGPNYKKVMKRTSKNIELMGHLQDAVLKTYMQKAKAFVFAAEEDFGIAPVEAQACGTPVIAFGKGGIRETVIPLQKEYRRLPSYSTCVNPGDGKESGIEEAPTGIFFNEQTSDSLIKAVRQFEAVGNAFNPQDIRKNAEKFSVERFRNEFAGLVKKKTEEFFGLSSTDQPDSF
jgi:glycosyltransferase involved in cell wall biosynthesis